MNRYRDAEAFGEQLGRELMAKFAEFVDTEVQGTLNEVARVAPQHLHDAAILIAHTFRRCATQIERQLPNRN